MRSARWVSAALLLALAASACGGGSEPPPPPRPLSTERSLLVIGNSLAHHAPLPEQGWQGDWGMAATQAARDFVHMLADRMKPTSLRIVRGVALEHGEVHTLDAQPKPGDVVVIELGDNVQREEEAFRLRFQRLLSQMQGAAQVICVTTWWSRERVDAIINEECSQARAKVVYIGDLLPQDIRIGTEKASGTVDAHPHDNSMAAIAQRILDAIE